MGFLGDKVVKPARGKNCTKYLSIMRRIIEFRESIFDISKQIYYIIGIRRYLEPRPSEKSTVATIADLGGPLLQEKTLSAVAGGRSAIETNKVKWGVNTHKTAK